MQRRHFLATLAATTLRAAPAPQVCLFTDHLGGFTAQEVEDARKGLLQERLVNRSQDGILAGAWVSNLDLGRTFEFSKQFEDRLKALTPGEVNAAFRKYIDPDRMTFVIAGDTKKGIKP